MKKKSQVNNTFKQRKDTFLRRGRYRWPYLKYTSYLAQPNTLAAAGFSFSPAKDAPDNVQCFLCGFELTGWEPTDDPFAEHYAHQPNCQYAKQHCQIRAARTGDKVEWVGWPYESKHQQLGKEDKRKEWERAQEMKEAVQMRLDTFVTEHGSGWPHLGKEEWCATPDKLARAGFYFTPEWPEDDTATCGFCGYALAEWEPEDDPNAEHGRRAPDCLFFKLNGPMPDEKEEEKEAAVSTPKSQPRRVSLREEKSEVNLNTPPQNKRQSPLKNEEPSPAAVAVHESDSPSSTMSKRQRVSDVQEEFKEVKEEEEEQVEVEVEVEVEKKEDVEDIAENDGDDEEEEEEEETQLTATQVEPAIDSIVETEEDVGMMVDNTEWELSVDEEEMTVEEFIRACCEQKIADLEASATQMISTFMQHAENTRERISSMPW